MDVYNQKMRASMAEKTFFIPHLTEEVDVIVDFGCANATMLQSLRDKGCNIEYIGFDANPDMISEASRNAAVHNLNRFTLTSCWDAVAQYIEGKKAALLLSSVIHEVYSYAENDDVRIFWERVWGSGFVKIFVRDMMISEKIERKANPQDVYKIKSNFDKALILQWEARWGPLTGRKSMLHFLLTYHYVHNWTREYLENYFPVSQEAFVKLIRDSKYKLDLFKAHRLPYLESKIKSDFGIQLVDNTHLIAVLTN